MKWIILMNKCESEVKSQRVFTSKKYFYFEFYWILEHKKDVTWAAYCRKNGTFLFLQRLGGVQGRSHEFFRGGLNFFLYGTKKLRECSVFFSIFWIKLNFFLKKNPRILKIFSSRGLKEFLRGGGGFFLKH